MNDPKELAHACVQPPLCAQQEQVREILARVADKWTLLVIDALEQGELRFSRLRERVGDVSQKMLTKTLRQLERDGLVTRRVYAEVPPRVDYQLTPLGLSLAQSLCGVWQWVTAHMEEVERARTSFDHRGNAAHKAAMDPVTAL